MLGFRMYYRREQAKNIITIPSFPGRNAMLFAEALEKCRRDKKTGLLNVSVVQSTKFLVRVYFKDGAICRLSYGPLHGRECLELLEYYDFGEAVYLDGMRAPRDAYAALDTDEIISAIKGMGKTIQLNQWFERRQKSDFAV
jgi:hypothetical protein